MAKNFEKEVASLARRTKKILAAQVRAEMKRGKVLPGELAARIKSSRAVVYRLRNPKETGVTLETLAKVSKALGIRLRVSFKGKR